MINAKTEFLEHIEDRKVLCASTWNNVNLKVNYTDADWNAFLKSNDNEYDNGYGGSCFPLDAFIWYTDGSWSERCEYDGSSWWSYKKCPPIPPNLLNENE